MLQLTKVGRFQLPDENVAFNSQALGDNEDCDIELGKISPPMMNVFSVRAHWGIVRLRPQFVHVSVVVKDVMFCDRSTYWVQVSNESLLARETAIKQLSGTLVSRTDRSIIMSSYEVLRVVQRVCLMKLTRIGI